MFGFRRGPSAEALAGSGPTTTYPAPPGASVTPEAIASIAGGTAAPTRSPSQTGSGTAQVAGIDITPGYATPASNVGNASPANLAAAHANGIHGGSATKPASYKSPDAKPSGYTFGSKALTPKPTDAVAPAEPAKAPTTSLAGGSNFAPPPTGGVTAPSTDFAPPSPASYTTPPTPPSKSSGGFTLPTDSPAMASIAPPSAASPPSAPPPAPTEVTPPAASVATPPAAAAPDFSTASASGAISVPSTSAVPSSTSPSGEYMPGSTAASPGYPTGNETPTTSGSFFR